MTMKGRTMETLKQLGLAVAIAGLTAPLAAEDRLSDPRSYIEHRLAHIPESDCTGDCYDACGAMLCMMGGGAGIAGCAGFMAILDGFIAIGRAAGFLKKCDTGSDDEFIRLLIMAHGACEDENLIPMLNQYEATGEWPADWRFEVEGRVPSVCEALADHQWSNTAVPVRVKNCHFEADDLWGWHGGGKEVCTYHWESGHDKDEPVTIIADPAAFLRDQGYEVPPL